MNVKRFLFLFLVGLFLVSCKTESEEIVIPPGAQVQYGTSQFIYYSDDRYSVFLREPTDVNGELETVLDLTPSPEDLLDGEKVHQIISPKDMALSGAYILQVNMEYHSLVLYDFIYDPEDIAYPSIVSTLAYVALSNYPDKSIQSYSASQIQSVKNFIESFAQKRMAQFQVSWETNPKLIYNFLKNGLEANLEFLELLTSVGAEYNYDETPTILSAPYPFGVPNNTPTFNEVVSTPAGLIVGKEQTPLEVMAEATDVDGDLLFYVWERDGEVILSDTQLYQWTPDSTEGGGDNYDLQVYVTDGGQILNVVWEIMIQDFNRKPEMTGACSPTATEKQTWECELTGVDPDGDSLTWSLRETGTNALPTLNGVAAPSSSTGGTATIRWTPNNADAKIGTATLEVRLDDGKNGFQIRNITILVEDVNSAPIIVGGGITPTNPNHLLPREWDYCLDADPLGQGAFTFDIVVEDPDNADPLTFPKDEVSINISGSLLSALESSPPTISGNQMIFHYSWKPQHFAKSGSIILLVQDDHGGSIPPTTLTVTADDMNQVPCRAAGFNQVLLVDGTIPVRNRTLGFDDGDDDPVLIRSRNLPLEVLHHMQSCDSAYSPIAMHRKSGEADHFHETYYSFSSQCIVNREKSAYAGVINFFRPGTYSSDVVIPKNTEVSVNTVTHNVRARYYTVMDVVMKADEDSVIVPVKAVQRTATANRLTEITGGPLADPSISVTNPDGNADQLIEYVDFSRASPFGSDVLIPSGLTLETDISLASNVPSLEYVVLEDVIFPAASTSVTDVPVRRKTWTVPAGQADLLVSSLTDPSIQATNPMPLYGRPGTVVYPYKATGGTVGTDRFCFEMEGYDGAVAAADEIQLVSGPLSGQLTVNNPTGFDFTGTLEITRSNTTSSQTFAVADYQFSTVNLKNYRLAEDVTFAIGEATKTVSINRELQTHTGVDEWYYNMCMAYRDRNYPPVFISSSSASVDEGTVNLGHMLQVTDRASKPYEYLDEDDRYSFTMTSSGTAPQGTTMLCREPAIDAANFANNCTPCTTTAGYTHFMSSKCYLRFQPHANDVAKTFQFNVTVNDNGASWPGNTNIRSAIINFTVNEFNDPPVFTDDSWSPYPGPIGDSETNPLDLGITLENVESRFSVFVEDFDETFDFKLVSFEIDPQVYDIQSASWVPTPSGLEVSVKDFSPNSGTPGAKTEGEISWTPTDYDVKRLSSSLGFVVKLRAFDAIGNAPLRQDDFIFLKLFVRNTNNAPEIETIGTDNSFEILADTYFSVDFEVSDKDGTTPSGGVFQTDLTLCMDNTGTPIAHATLDPAPVPPVTDCHATSFNWPVEILTYDAAYSANRNVGASECRSGADEVNLNEDLAVPKFTRIAGPHFNSGQISFTYRMEWCPQKGQLGDFSIGLRVTDNGDVAVDGTTENALAGSSPLNLRVKAPVFFESPRLDNLGLPDHFMVQSSGGLTGQAFEYQTIVNNSQGNSVNYEIVSSPRPCAVTHGVCIDQEGVLSWVPDVLDETNPSDSSTWHRIEIKVTDLVTLDEDQVHFFLQVQNPLGPPVEQPPSIDSESPVSSTVQVNEREVQAFSVTASDPNPDDVLHYRWYVDGELIEDEGATFNYRPSETAGTEDLDDVGPLKPGEHSVRVEVDDGNSSVSHEWMVQVANTSLKPEKIFDVFSARNNPSITNLKWFQEVSLNISVGANEISYLLFSGQYQFGASTNNYAWSLEFVNGEIQTDWNYYDSLSWLTGFETENVAYSMTSSTSFEFLLSPQLDRYGPYGSTTNSVKLQGDYSGLAIPLKTGNVCSGSCARNHYTGDGRYGSRPGDSYGSYFFFASNDGTDILWDKNASGNNHFHDVTAGSQVIDMKINEGLEHLYVTTQDLLTKYHRFLVFDVNPVHGGGDPVLLADLNVYDGTPSHVDSRPSDIVVDEANDQVYVFLSGTGGVLRVDDSGGTPGLGQMSYIGVSEIEASLGDRAMKGQRLTMDSTKGIIYGVSRDGRQVFTIDINDSYAIKVVATAQKFDSIQIFEGQNLILLIDRDNSAVFKAL